MNESRPSVFWRWFIGTAFVLVVLLSVHIHNAIQPKPRPAEVVKEKRT